MYGAVFRWYLLLTLTMALVLDRLFMMHCALYGCVDAALYGIERCRQRQSVPCGMRLILCRLVHTIEPIQSIVQTGTTLMASRFVFSLSFSI